MKFICSKCNKIFENYNECVSHENKCIGSIKSENKNKKCYLKYIMLDSDYNDNEIHIYEHPDAIQVRDNYYNCCPNNRHYDEVIEIKEFDTVFLDDNCYYCIIVKNENEEHERESIKKLFDYKKQKMIDYYNDLQEKINTLGNSYETYRKII